jgi:DNA-binding MarR family transcriptional regulator
MATSLRIARSATDLRIVLGQLVRLLSAQHAFPFNQATVLTRLEREGAMTTAALAAAERVRPQSMAHTVSDLHAQGLLSRKPDPSDRRQVLIELTDRGLEALLTERRQREGWLAEAIAGELLPEEQEIVIQAVPLLRRLSQL